MSKLLYVQASPRVDRSYSIAAADAFVESYAKSHPSDEVVSFNLFAKDLPAFDEAAVNAKYKILHGKEHSQEDRAVWNAVEAVIEEFKSADKYLLATPMWNFSIPYRLKLYIDILVQPGYTFNVTEDGGYVGLVTGKPLCTVYARGGAYAPGGETEAYDLQKRYIETIFSFMGFTDIRPVIAEPTLALGPEEATAARERAIAQARELAEEF